MDVEFNSAKKNQGLMVGCPRTAHVLCFGTVKTVQGLCEMDQKGPCVGCLKLMK